MATTLRKRMLEDMTLRGYSASTQKLYLSKVTCFARYHGKSPSEMGDEEIREYLLYLVREKKISASAFKHAICGIKFLYEVTLGRTWHTLDIARPRLVKILPVVLSKPEVKAILDGIKNIKHKALIATIYSGGLRLSEASNLQAADIDSTRMTIKINQSKFNKDRYVPLGKETLKLLRAYWKAYRPSDWLFPGKPETNSISLRSVQKIFTISVKSTGIKKKVSVKTLRHSFATHLMDAGVHLRYIQIILGHKSASTTAIYTHISKRRLANIVSPIDTL